MTLLFKIWYILIRGGVTNLVKNPSYLTRRCCTLTIKSIGFYFVVLVAQQGLLSSLKVGKRFAGTRRPVFSFKLIQTNFVEIQLPRDTRKVNAWGKNHLWFRYRKGSRLSGLVEPRILVHLCRGVSKNTNPKRSHIRSTSASLDSMNNTMQ